MERTYIDTLAQLIARSPTCYHAAATAAELLAAAGYAPLDEGQRWQLRPGGKYYMTRGGSALIAFRVPERAPAGFRLAAAHGDSPCFKLKENAALRDGGYLRLNTEVYGGLRMSSWFDRPLSVAGRLFTEEDGVLRQTLVNIDRDLLVIPSVAIHFDRAANDGVKYRANVDTLPLAGGDGAADILTLAAESAGLRPEDVLGSDLLVYCRQPGTRLGSSGELFMAPRLDDQACVWSCLHGFLESGGGSAAAFRALCRRADVPVQTMANRSDLPGGSTLGSIAGTLVPVSAVDIGLAQLAMHAAVEVMGAEDYPRLIAAMRQFYNL